MTVRPDLERLVEPRPAPIEKCQQRPVADADRGVPAGGQESEDFFLGEDLRGQAPERLSPPARCWPAFPTATWGLWNGRSRSGGPRRGRRPPGGPPFIPELPRRYRPAPLRSSTWPPSPRCPRPDGAGNGQKRRAPKLDAQEAVRRTE